MDPTVPSGDLMATMPSAPALAFLIFILALAILNSTNLLKILVQAFTPPNWPTEPHPWYWQFLWRAIPIGLGVLYGWLSECSDFFSFPWGLGAGLISATFMTTIYNRGKKVIEGLKLRSLDSSVNDDSL
jgi:hypothetical protein